MKLSFIKVSELESNIKATVHRNGRLGFNGNAQKKMDLDKYKFIQIAIGEDFDTDGTLYVKLTNDKSVDGFTLAVAGGYYYINAKPLFEKFSIDFENNKIVYNISEFVFEGDMYFKLKKRQSERKNDDTDEDDL